MASPRELILGLWKCDEDDLIPSQKVNLKRAVRRFQQWGSIVEALRERRTLCQHQRDRLRQGLLTWIRAHVPTGLLGVLSADELANRLFERVAERLPGYRYEQELWVWISPVLRFGIVCQPEIKAHVLREANLNIDELARGIQQRAECICNKLCQEWGIVVGARGVVNTVLFGILCGGVETWQNPQAEQRVRARVQFIVNSRWRPVDLESIDQKTDPARYVNETKKIHRLLAVFSDLSNLGRARAARGQADPGPKLKSSPPSCSGERKRLTQELCTWEQELRVRNAIVYLRMSGVSGAEEVLQGVIKQVLDDIISSDLEFEEKLKDARLQFTELLLAHDFPLYSGALVGLPQPRRRGGLNPGETAAIWLMWHHTELAPRSGLWRLYWTSGSQCRVNLPEVIKDVFEPCGNPEEDEHYLVASLMTLNAVHAGRTPFSVCAAHKCLARLLQRRQDVRQAQSTLTDGEKRILKPLLVECPAACAAGVWLDKLREAYQPEPGRGFDTGQRRKLIAWAVETCVDHKDPREVARSLKEAHSPEENRVDQDILRGGNTLRDQFVRAVFKKIETY